MKARSAVWSVLLVALASCDHDTALINGPQDLSAGLDSASDLATEASKPDLATSVRTCNPSDKSPCGDLWAQPCILCGPLAPGWICSTPCSSDVECKNPMLPRCQIPPPQTTGFCTPKVCCLYCK